MRMRGTISLALLGLLIGPPASAQKSRAIDSQAVNLLTLANTRLAGFRSLHARLVLAVTQPGAPSYSMSQTVSFMRSGFLRTDELRRADSPDSIRVIGVSTPNQRWEWTDRSAMVDHLDLMGYHPDLVPVRGFFDTRLFQGAAPTPAIGDWQDIWLIHPLFQGIRWVGRCEWERRLYDLVEWRYSRSAELPESEDTYISVAYVGVSDTLIHRVVTTQWTGGEATTRFDARVTDLAINPTMSIADFLPPPGMPVTEHPPQYPAASVYLDKPWLPLDAPARLLDGQAITKVSNLLAGKKALVLWAWNTGCSVCMEEFPWMERLRREFDLLGVATVALDPGDEEEEAKARRYMAHHEAAMPVVFGAKAWESPMYDSIGIAVVDRDGIVRYAGGLDLEEIWGTLNRLVQ